MTGKPINIVFMGNPDFAVPGLNELLKSDHHVTAVVSGPDKRRGRGMDLTPTPVKKAALEAGLSVIEVEDVSGNEFIQQLRDLKPDLLVVVAFKILPDTVLSIPLLGSINLHASLLPKYRGAAPIHWALVNGEKETGCTVFMLNEGMDTGMILNQSRSSVEIHETTGDVYHRLKEAGATLLVETVNRLSTGDLSGIQQEDQQSSMAPKVTTDDAIIDFNKNCMSVHNLIRGMSPSPAAWFRLKRKKIKILRSKPAPNMSLPAGRVELVGGKCYAGCGQGSVILLEVQPEGKKRVSGLEFVNGLGGKIDLF